MWGFDGSSTRQAEGSNSDCLLQPVAVFPDPARVNGALVMCEVLLPDGTPHPSNSRATIPDDPDTWFGFEQEYFLYRDGVAARLPARGVPGPAGRVLHRRRLQERRRRRPRDRVHPSRPLPRRRHQPRGHQRRGGQGPVGVPDLRQGLEAGRRRGVGRPVPAPAALREVPRRRELPPEAARHGVRLERLRDAHELLDQAPPRGRRRRSTSRRSWPCSTSTRTSTSPSTAPTTTCASPGSTRRRRSTSSTTGSPTAARRSASRTAS